GRGGDARGGRRCGGSMTSDTFGGAARAGGGVTTRVLVLWENGGASYVLGAGERAKLGRHADCEIGIELPSVSRRHARLHVAASVSSHADVLATVEDIGGMNGVCVRGQKIATNVPVPVSA